MKSQDILVMLKLSANPEDRWSYASLSESLGMSQSEIHAAVKRCERSGLYNAFSKRENRIALREFLVHGLRYVFPAELGAVRQGIPTSSGAEPLRSKIQDLSEIPVMPMEHGPVRGPSIEPLYRCAPQAALKDPKLHRLLAIVDALRSGQGRERKLACEALNMELVD